MEPVEIPSAAGGDEGLEGFAVRAGGRRVGRVAALNATDGGLAVVVDTGDAYLAIPARHVTAVETASRTVLVDDAGAGALAAAAPVEPLVRLGDSPRLVRYVPRELERLLVAGHAVAERRSRLWYAGAALAAAGSVGVMAGPLLTAAGVGGPILRWLWLAVPLALLALAGAVLWHALDRDSARPLSPAEKLAEAFAFVLGITPRTRRRG